MARIFLIFVLAIIPICQVQCDASWELFPGSAQQISAKGTELWAVSKTNQIMRWDGKAWTCMGFGTYVGACSDKHAYLVNQYAAPQVSNVWRYNPTPTGYEYEKWHAMDGLFLATINCFDASNAIGVGFDGRIFKHVPGKTPDPWARFDEKDVVFNNLHAAIGEAGEIWKLDMNGKLYRFQNSAWKELEKPPPVTVVVNFDVQNDKRVVIVDSYGQAHFWNGSDWSLLGPSVKQCTINPDGVYCVDLKGGIWKAKV